MRTAASWRASAIARSGNGSFAAAAALGVWCLAFPQLRWGLGSGRRCHGCKWADHELSKLLSRDRLIPQRSISMVPLSDDEAINLLYRRYGAWTRQYLWETLSNIEWNNDRPPTAFLHEDSYYLIFDPNPWNLRSRRSAGLHFSSDGAPMGYQVTREELLGFSYLKWTFDADFYVLELNGELCATRTHEDPASECGFWIPIQPNVKPEAD
ncbi:MAG: hypothetical protein K8R36_14595 [Planctomycetales bacterium]|nr:hypothetical protein [Planctomycetales bacterium]